jgi:flagellar biosynthesis protein FlhG
MADQATQLRRLAAGAERTFAQQPTQRSTQHPDRRPHVIAVTAGKGGVGTTTVAIGLAAALASEEQSALLVDGNSNNPDVAVACGITGACGITVDTLKDSTALKAILWGPSGMHVAPHSHSDSVTLIEQIHAAPYDVVVVDAGSGINREVRSLWRAADQIVLVTGEQVIAAMDAYAAVKLMAFESPQPISTIVNAAQSPEIAAGIHMRIAQACQRFLGRELLAGGSIAHDPKFVEHCSDLRSDGSVSESYQASLQFRQLAHHATRIANELRRTEQIDGEVNQQSMYAVA